MEKKTVVMGAHGPVCIEDNPRRFIGADPVEVPMTAYYHRRLADGEIVEVADGPKQKELAEALAGEELAKAEKRTNSKKDRE